jgi:hypothetical protein
MMPGFDGTGPMGTGPVGRRMGPCSNPNYVAAPVTPRYGWFRPFTNAFYGLRRGFGRGYYGYGAGYGRGFGRGFGYGRGRGAGFGRGWW